MKIFGIGLSGYAGSVICEKLIADGHQVRAMALPNDNAEGVLQSLGATIIPGSMADFDLIKKEAAADAVVQCSIGGFFTAGKGRESEVVGCVDAILETLAGTGKPYLFQGGMAFYMRYEPDGHGILYEHDGLTMEPNGLETYAHIYPLLKRLYEEGPKRNIRTVVINPAGIYGRLGGYIGHITRRFESFRKHGVVYASYTQGYISGVHVDDLADLYVLALHKAKAGSRYFAATDSAANLEICRMVSRVCGLKGRLVFVPEEKIIEMDWTSFVDFKHISVLLSSIKAHQELGWRPKMPGILDEMQRLADEKADPFNIYPGPTRQAHFAGLKMEIPEALIKSEKN